MWILYALICAVVIFGVMPYLLLLLAGATKQEEYQKPEELCTDEDFPVYSYKTGSYLVAIIVFYSFLLVGILSLAAAFYSKDYTAAIYGIIICPICIPVMIHLILKARKTKEETDFLRMKINREGIWVLRTKPDKDKLFKESFEAILWEDILDVAVRHEIRGGVNTLWIQVRDPLKKAGSRWERLQIQDSKYTAEYLKSVIERYYVARV